MKYLRKFNEELNKSTYISAANKLRNMGGENKMRRADELEKHSMEKGQDYEVDYIHLHEFTIDGTPGYLINGSSDASYKARRTRKRTYITVYMYNSYKDKKSITIEFTYYGENGWACNYGEHVQVSCVQGDLIEMWLNYYNEKGEWEDDSPGFLFENRKDAVEFKKFVMDFLKNEPEYAEYSEELEALSKVTINQMID